MLRLIVLFLLLANALFFAWSTGSFNPFGISSATKNESFRLEQQIEPNRISLQLPNNTMVTTTETTTLAVDANPPVLKLQVDSSLDLTATICLMSVVLNDKQSIQLKQTLDSEMPNLNWRFDVRTLPERWIVYMGKYGNTEQLEVKKKQLKQINVPFEALSQVRLEPGLSLGSYPTQAAANQTLQNLTKQGIRTARVLQESPEQPGQIFIASAVDKTTRPKLEALYATVLPALSVKALQICE